MKCETIQAWMRERFDQDLPLEQGFAAHLHECAACRAYRDRLDALHGALAQLAVEEPSAQFLKSLAAKAKPIPNRVAGPWVAAALVMLSAASVVLGWFSPLSVDWTAALEAAAKWRAPLPETTELFSPISMLAREAVGVLAPIRDLAPSGPPWIFAGGVAVLVIALVGFNASLRMAGENHSMRPTHHSSN